MASSGIAELRCKWLFRGVGRALRRAGTRAAPTARATKFR